MTFLAPLWLIAAGLIALVVLLHTMRRTQQVVPSLYLWKRLEGSQRPRRTFRPPLPSLLLLLQCLAVLLIALALAFPIFGDRARPAHHILVLDTSLSMAAATAEDTTRFDDVRASLMGEIERLAALDGARVTLIETGAHTRYLAVRQSPADALGALSASVAPTAATPDWRAVATHLNGLGAAEEDQIITLFTDKGDAARAALDGVLADATITVRAPSEGAGRNFGVTAQATPLAQPNAWEIVGTVSGDAATAEEAPALVARYRPVGATTTLDWAEPALQRPRGIAPEDIPTSPFRFVVNAALPGPGVFELALEADAIPLDDRFTFIFDDPLARAEVLYVGPGNRNLDIALLATGLVELFAGQSLPDDADHYDLVIVENTVIETRPDTNVLWLGSARLAAEPAPARGRAELTRWDEEHPLSRSVEWRTVEGVEAYIFPQDLPGRVVLTAGDSPLLVARTLPTGRDIRMPIAIGTEGWVRDSVLPALVVNIVDWLATGVEDAARYCEAGARCAFPARYAGAAITGPDGVTVRAEAEGDADTSVLDGANSFVPALPGLYTIGEGEQARLVAVNAAARDIGQPLLSIEPGEAGEAYAGTPLPLWFWLALAAAIVLTAELILALRVREGFARTVQLGASSAAVRRKRLSLGLRGVAILLVIVALFVPPFLALFPARTQILVASPSVMAGSGVACGGIFPQAQGAVALAGAPYVVQDTSCTPVAGIRDNAPEGASTVEALELAAAMVPPGGEGRVILLADRASASAPLDGASEAFADRALPLDVVVLDAQDGEGVWVSSLVVPEALRAGDYTTVTVTLGSARAGEVDLIFGVDDREVSRATFPLEPGATRIDARLPELEEGEVVIWAEIAGAGDNEPGNDRIEVLRNVLARPVIGIVTPEREWGGYMADALAVQGLDSEVVAPNRAPFWMHDWLNRFDGVMLMNVPAIDLDTRQQEQLDEFVRVHGRGLMILGGENTFGPGGYFQTPLEAISPLSSRVPQEAPVAALAFVLDRSGSMQAMVDGVTRLDIAKQATIAAVELLNPESQVAVVVFDEMASVIVPMQDRKDDAQIAAALARLDPGGGTSIAPGLEEALNQMADVDAPVRHIIVMSDGLTQPGDFESLMVRAGTMGITVSTVAIGEGADVGRLADLARIGGGSSHATRDFRALPSILSQEAMMLGGDPMEFGTFPVAWLDRSADYLAGIPDLPDLGGYVLTSEKPGASLHLATVDDEGERVPLMASWRYGNGHVLALATHAVGPGSLAWQSLPQFPLIYGQPMRHFLAEAPDPGISVVSRRSGDALVIESEILTRAGQPFRGLAPVAHVSDEQGAPIADLALRPEGAGVYTARTAPLPPGRYTIAVEAGEDPETRTQLEAEIAVLMSYSAALDPFRSSPDGLAALAGQTGGTVTTVTPDLGSGLPRLGVAPSWRPFLVLALALFLLDLALRYAPGLFAWGRARASQSRPDGARTDAATDSLPRAA